MTDGYGGGGAKESPGEMAHSREVGINAGWKSHVEHDGGATQIKVFSI